MTYKNIYEYMSDIWSKYSRHLSISCCFLTQNLYHKGDSSANKFGRDLLIISSHKIIFKSISDKHTALSIGKSLGNYKFFKEVYESCFPVFLRISPICPLRTGISGSL